MASSLALLAVMTVRNRLPLRASMIPVWSVGMEEFMAIHEIEVKGAFPTGGSGLRDRPGSHVYALVSDWLRPSGPSAHEQRQHQPPANRP